MKKGTIELIAITSLVAVDLWLVWDRPGLLILIRALAMAVLVASLLRRRGDWPKRRREIPTGRAWLEAGAGTLVLGLAVLAWAVMVGGPFDQPNTVRLAGPASVQGLWLARRLGLACVQQLGLHLFLWPVAREVFASGRLATVAVAVLFGLFHLPSIPFAIATAVAAALWIGLYRRSKRLAPLIVSHALLAAMAWLLPTRLFYDMKVGAPALEIAAEQRSLESEEKQALLGAFAAPRYSTYRGGTDSGYVAGLYRDILGRVATDDEVNDGVGWLRVAPRLALVKRMLLSEELDETTLWRRIIDDEPLTPGIEITPSSGQVEFEGWYAAEGAWRWARDPTPTIGFRMDREPERVYVLTISGGAAAPPRPEAQQQLIAVGLELNGHSVGTSRFTDFTPRDHRFLLDANHLVAASENTLRFLVSGAPMAVAGDSRLLGFGLHQLRIAPLRFPSAAILFDEDDYFLTGFSGAEERLRWTSELTARLIYPLPRIVPEACYTLQLRAGAFERQEMNLSVNDQKIADWTLDGLEPQIRSVRLDAEQLHAGPNTIDFHLPGARSPEGDPRRLGLALISFRIYPLKDCS